MSASGPIDERILPPAGPPGWLSLAGALSVLALTGVGVLLLAGVAIDWEFACNGPDTGALKKVRDNDDAMQHIGWTRGQVEATYGPPGDRFPGRWDATYFIRYDGLMCDPARLALDYDRDVVIRAVLTSGD